MSGALTIREIVDADIARVIALWHSAGVARPWNDPGKDIAFARTEPHSTVLVACDGDELVATAMVGEDGHRGWVYYVATDPDLRGQGYGRAMMNASEDWLRAAGIAKLQLLVRPENAGVAAFYQSIGFGEQPILFFTKWLDGREPPR